MPRVQKLEYDFASLPEPAKVFLQHGFCVDEDSRHLWLSKEALLDFLYDSGDGWEHHCPEEWAKNPTAELVTIPEWWWTKMQFSPEVRAEMESLWALDPAFEVEWE